MHFGKKQSSDPIEERLDKVEAILPYLIRRDEHENVYKQGLLNQAQNQDLHNTMKAVAEIAGRANEGATKMSEVLLNHVTHYGKIKDNLYDGIEICRKENDQLKSVLKDVNKALVKNGEMHDIYQKQTRVLQDLLKEDRETIKHLESKILKLCDEVVRLNAELNSQASGIQDVKGLIPTFKEDNRNVKVALNKLIVELAKSYNENKESISDVISTFNKQLVKTRTDLENKFSELTEIIIPSESDILSKVDAKLDAISMDAKNASLRSSNTESKMVLMEKKIENIKLLLQRHELDK